MSASERLLERLPPIVQSERTRDEENVTYDSVQDVYTIPKAPVISVEEVTGFVNGERTTFVRGTDYELVENADGDITDIDWSIGGDNPDDGTEFTVDIQYRTIIQRYTEAHEEEFDFLDQEIEDVIDSHEIDNASGDDLDKMGAIFGQLGRRRGRSDSDYRIYLKSVVQSFNGRGSVSGLKFAIASSVGANPEDIEIIERFDDLEYDIQIFNVDTPFISSAINDLAELADPSVVQLGEAVIVIGAGGVQVGSDPSVAAVETAGLGGETLTLDGNSQLG